MLPNWLYGKSKSKLQEIFSDGSTPADYDQVKAQVAQNKADIELLDSENQALTKQITVNGAVNELNHTGITDTSGTVKFTVNEDKSITVSADSYPVTMDSTVIFFFFGTNSAAVPNIFKGKKFVGCPSGGAAGTYRIIIQEFTSTTPSGAVAESSDIGEGANISNGDYIRMYIRLGSGYQLTSALTFKPMVFLAGLELSYDDYVPYAMTNRKLTEENKIEIASLTGDVTFNSNKVTKKNGIVTINAVFQADKDYNAFTQFVNIPSEFRSLNDNPIGFLFNDTQGTVSSVTSFSTGKIQASAAITAGEYYRLVMSYIIT